MSLSDLTTASVQAALGEFDEIGRDAFLARYGFGKSRGYFVVHNGQRYDSKAIAGAAHGYLAGQSPLTAATFSGGDKTVANTLAQLGFSVTRPDTSTTQVLPFDRGEVYSRQAHIHQLFGGQERGGIATPDAVPWVFLFTGESGGAFGYSDAWQDDGTFTYTGEGQRGDMQFVRGNRAIRDHLRDGRDLLLFQALATKGRYRFLGCFACAGWKYRSLPDRDGLIRQGIVFQLVPIEDVPLADHDSSDIDALADTGRSLSELRQRAYAAASAPPVPPKDARRSYHRRSEEVKVYVLARAAGKCEACTNVAPFKRKDGTPYLEPHHTLRVADGGPDHPRFVGAVCPTCHREIHHGANGPEINDKLMARLLAAEPIEA